jgi:hypothetical protein
MYKVTAQRTQQASKQSRVLHVCIYNIVAGGVPLKGKVQKKQKKPKHTQEAATEGDEAAAGDDSSKQGMHDPGVNRTAGSNTEALPASSEGT